MTDVSITFITPTMNRPSLRHAYESLVPQLGPKDVHLIVTDGFPITDLPYLPRAFAVEGPWSRKWGHAQREWVLQNPDLRRTTHVAFLDDDDLMTWGAVDSIRKVAADAPEANIIARFQPPVAGVVWGVTEIREGNVGTPCFILPWNVKRLGSWSSERYQADFDFIYGTVKKNPEVVWMNRVIQIARRL